MSTDTKPDTLFSFFEYHSIDTCKANTINTYSKLHPDEKWLVLEKVHGANFSFYCDGNIIACSRRNALLHDFETFFGFQEVREKYRNSIIEIFKDVKNGWNEEENGGVKVKNVVVFGELFGGIYPHPDVEDLGLLHIQKGVYYFNGIEFYAFDIWIDTDDGKGRWMNYFKAMELFDKHGMFYSKPLLVGTLEECFKFNYKINSTIPKLLNLPPIEKNQMEGIIVKSAEPVEPTKKGTMYTRVIFKFKNKNFEEVNPKVPLTKHERTKKERKEALEICYEEIDRFINENRLNSVRSKLGPVTEETMEAAAAFMHEDVMKDFCKACEKQWDLLDETSRGYVSNSGKSKVNTFIADWLRANK